MIDEPDVLVMVADAYAQLGLPDRALYALISDFGIGSKQSVLFARSRDLFNEVVFPINRFYEVHRTIELMDNKRLPARLRPEDAVLRLNILGGRPT